MAGRGGVGRGVGARGGGAARRVERYATHPPRFLRLAEGAVVFCAGIVYVCGCAVFIALADLLVVASGRNPNANDSNDWVPLTWFFIGMIVLIPLFGFDSP